MWENRFEMMTTHNSRVSFLTEPAGFKTKTLPAPLICRYFCALSDRQIHHKAGGRGKVLFWLLKICSRRQHFIIKSCLCIRRRMWKVLRASHTHTHAANAVDADFVAGINLMCASPASMHALCGEYNYVPKKLKWEKFMFRYWIYYEWHTQKVSTTGFIMKVPNLDWVSFYLRLDNYRQVFFSYLNTHFI